MSKKTGKMAKSSCSDGVNIVEQVRSAAAEIVSLSSYVRLNDDGLRKLLDRVAALHTEKSGEKPPSPPDEIHFFDGTERTVMYLLALDAVNFCFWPEEFTVRYGGRTYGDRSRYQAVATALRRGFEEDFRLARPEYLKDLPLEEMRRVFRTDSGRMPLIEERWFNLRNLGETLVNNFDGSATVLLDMADWHAPKLVQILHEEFPCYRDEREYCGIWFPVLKRAQIFASDLAYMFRSEGYGRLTGLDELTAFADYRLPQYMRDCGALEYAPELDRTIAAGEELPEGCDEEVEIRAHTIHAVELLRDELVRRGIAIAPREIDYLIWEDRVSRGELSVRPHRTVTTGY